MKRLLIATASVVALASPATALKLECKVTGKGDGFIAPNLFLEFEPGQQTGTAYDGVIDMVHGAPIEAKLRKLSRSDSEYRLNWSVNNVPARPRPVRIAYHATVNLADNSVIVRGSIRGATNLVTGTGQCKVR
ncbi:hypothetical protein [uncultured Tateyamaria sp.]|uniref:hypothetical protein n=1 Tax=uncultured Tateyamaria sp. TaxID=455651 RepID=UPI002603F1EA|nr:hypothetical protein [uncultured Tateyamaria sp.]